MMYCVIYSFSSIPNLQWPPLYCPPDRTTFLILSFILTCVTILSTVLAYHISKVMNLRRLEGVDRISSLPDELLCHILSFLPTKLAVTTSILSTRWKHLPDFVPDIDLSDNNIGHSNAEHTINSIKLRNDRFMHAVLKVLTVRTFPTILDIPKFSLSCFFLFDHHIFCQSIKLLVMRNVRKLNLSLLLEDSATLPDEILKCKSLEVLKLNCELCLNVPESVILPNLKVIELYNLDFFGDSSIRKLLAGCPSLEDLWLSFCLFEEENVEISHPLLKHVTLTDLMGDYYLIFDTPNLRNLMCISDRDVVTVVKNMKSLVHAHMCCGSVDTQLEQVEDEEWEDLQLESINGTNFINEMHEAKFLYLEGSAINALFFSDCSFSTFQNLSLMELGSTHVSGWLVLPELLECTPNLKVLVFYEGFINWDSPANEFEYCLPLSAPACFSGTLEEIKVGAFGGYECELELIEYFLKSVQGLKMMMIGAQVSSVSPFGYPRFYRPSEYLKKPEKWVVPTCERLSVVPRCSKACQIMLTWNEGSKIL